MFSNGVNQQFFFTIRFHFKDIIAESLGTARLQMSCWMNEVQQPGAKCQQCSVPWQEVPSQGRTLAVALALAVLQHHSWVRTLCADEATDKVSICLRHGKTLLCHCSVNTFLWCSFICSSKSDFYFLGFIFLFPMAFPNSPSPLVTIDSHTGEPSQEI